MFRLEKFQSISLLVSKWSALLVVLMLPFSTAATNIGLGLCLLGWLLSGNVIADCKKLIRHPVVLPIVCFYLFMLLSTLWATVPFAHSMDEFLKYRKVIILLLFMAVFWNDEVWKERVLAALFVSLFALALWCICLAAGVPGVPKLRHTGQATLLKHHITQGFLMSILAILSFRMLAFGKVWWKVCIGIAGCAAASILTFYFTDGRTGYVCVAVAFLAGAWFLVKSLKLKLAVVAAVCLAVGVAVFTSDRVQKRIEHVRVDLVKFEKGNINTSSGLRFAFWQESLKMIRDNPVGGVGIGSWSQEFYKAAYPDAKKKPWHRHGHAHNDYLNTAASVGLVGFFFWMLFLWRTVRSGRQLPERDKWLLAGFMSVWLTGCLFNSFLHDFTEGNTLAIILGLLMAQCVPKTEEQS